ncbi:MAG TPA: murein biosynthesis integral membrane protein MurJ [Pyrinomonadaceae bacterium]|jgi:putative peptidoglycan lipid II flippase|nr:murein biosynthesis integral membrane protein MurJ [Pyrinomonadaceae bacterium]
MNPTDKPEDSQPIPTSVEALEEGLPLEHALSGPEPVTAEQPKEKTQSVAKSAGIVSVAVMGSRVLGLVREMVFARYFGAGFLYDAYQVAFTIPNVLRDLFAEGALSAAFVKVFTDYQLKKSEEEAWRLASMVLNALVVVLSVFVLLGILLAPYFVPLLASGFSPEKAALTVTMTQIMLPFILLVAMAALAMGVLNTKGKFGIPASASTAFNIISIIAGLIFAFWFSGGNWEKPVDKESVAAASAQWAIIGMAIGTLIGGAAQFVVQVPSLWRVGFRFSPIISFTDAGVRKVMRLMAPAILGTSAVQINVLVNTVFVTEIEGGRSWLSYAFRLMQFPIGIFGVAIGTAAIPALSRLASQNDLAGFRKTLSDSIGLVFFLTLPSACGLVVLSEPIIRLLYERGVFKSSDTPMTAYALAAYTIGLTGYAAIKVLSPSFYALDDAKKPMIIALCSIVVNAIASYFFMRVFSQVGVTPEHPHGFGHVGVALATSTVALVNFLALAYFMRRRIKRIHGWQMVNSFARIAAASALLSAASYGSYYLLTMRLGIDGFFVRLIEVFVPIAIGGTVFLVASKLFGVRELNQAYNNFAKRLGRR